MIKPAEPAAQRRVAVCCPTRTRITHHSQSVQLHFYRCLSDRIQSVLPLFHAHHAGTRILHVLSNTRDGFRSEASGLCGS